MNPTSAGSNSLSAGLANPINNPRAVRITKLDSGYLIEKQNVDNYGNTNDVAIDLASAVSIASSYLES